jgi:hypothetical protein
VRFNHLKIPQHTAIQLPAIKLPPKLYLYTWHQKSLLLAYELNVI